ncbi:HNH endonuclease [Tardiphaga robiniae]|uniref:HNH endonuclease n=1 Tax=Tardiphaga robiniae TaxID=943830 RepID=A0A7G6TVQ0_9BRAD|nr:hypothetical protein [Tardiphaga robiniae]QND70832.1 HNH endonuclease [Tardiphaga robiniae]
MTYSFSRIDGLLLEGRYELLREIKGSTGAGRVKIGRMLECRYCSTRRANQFRKIAHTFPEALGNKWVISLDECDQCNQLFSLYEGALANAVSPFLTLGGVRGKGNKTRQTGRTAGNEVLEQRRTETGRQFLAVANGYNLNSFASVNSNGNFEIKIPIAGVPFVPRLAYKALAKMGYALLPDDELQNYQKLKAWLLDTNDRVDFPVLECGMSFASIGHAPPFVAGCLLRRVAAKGMHPHIIFIFCAGSICFQLDLLSDHLEDHIPPVPCGAIGINYSVIIGDDKGERLLTFDYGMPIHINWASQASTPQPVETMILNFNPQTLKGEFTPVFR